MADSETNSVDEQCQDSEQFRTEEEEVSSASGDSSNGATASPIKTNPFQGVKPAKFVPGIVVPGMNPFAVRQTLKSDVVSTSSNTSSTAKFILRPSALSANPQNSKNEVPDGLNAGSVSSLLKPAKLPDPTKPNSKEQEVTEKENTEASLLVKDKNKDPPDSSHENLFQTALKEYHTDKKIPDSSSSPRDSNSTNHVSDSDSILGQNLTTRVTGVHSSTKGVVSSSGFVFGENLAERVQFNKDEKSEDNGVASPDSTDQSEHGAVGAADVEKSLEESAREYQATHSKNLELEEVQVVTGEENESNVLQTNGKLFIFDGETQNWVERGRGLIRLNDMRCPQSQTFQSRLVMRTQGSLRLILNTKVWPGMTVERASNKSVRITGTDGECVKVFLISTNPKDSENLLRALDWRVQQLRVEEEKEKTDNGHLTKAGAEKRKAEPESPTDPEEFTAKKTKKSDDECVGSYRREESDSSVVDPETEASNVQTVEMRKLCHTSKNVVARKFFQIKESGGMETHKF